MGVPSAPPFPQLHAELRSGCRLGHRGAHVPEPVAVGSELASGAPALNRHDRVHVVATLRPRHASSVSKSSYHSPTAPNRSGTTTTITSSTSARSAWVATHGPATGTATTMAARCVDLQRGDCGGHGRSGRRVRRRRRSSHRSRTTTGSSGRRGTRAHGVELGALHTRRPRRNGLVRCAAPSSDIGVPHHHGPRGDRAHRQLLVTGHPQLAHHVRVERKVERNGDRRPRRRLLPAGGRARRRQHRCKPRAARPAGRLHGARASHRRLIAPPRPHTSRRTHERVAPISDRVTHNTLGRRSVGHVARGRSSALGVHLVTGQRWANRCTGTWCSPVRPRIPTSLGWCTARG